MLCFVFSCATSYRPTPGSFLIQPSRLVFSDAPSLTLTWGCRLRPVCSTLLLVNMCTIFHWHTGPSKERFEEALATGAAVSEAEHAGWSAALKQVSRSD